MVPCLVYHAKNGGDIDGPHFTGSEVFFAASPKVALRYAEHCWYQDCWPYNACESRNYDDEVLGAQPVVFPVRLSLQNPAILGRWKLRQIGKSLGVAAKKLARFADDFEDSGPTEREMVFAWLRSNGYDGAILPRDQMPKYVGGDWYYIKSFVAFHPERQVEFAISNPTAAHS